MRARFQLRCLGEPALLTIGGRPIKLRTRKQLALLCYLGMEKRWHARDLLAELLWPDRDHSSSRHSLAVALSGLRGKLGREILESVQDRVRLHPDGVEVDVDRLLAGDVLGSETEVPLDVDGFLEGFEVPEALPFAHWRDAERARLLPNVLDALVVLIDRCRRTGDFRQIETMGLRLQRFEPLSEHAMRARMEARAFAGDRLTALRLFEQWKLDLEAQLRAAPSDLLEGMALRLRRRGWERPGSADIPTVHTDHWKDRPFVGRAREYRELYEAWEGAQRCEASHRLILGDSGIGKSTLVERLTTAAGLEGATVARVQCHEAEREIPYTMASGLIAQLVERPGASATPPESLAELAQTIPAVRQRFPVLPTAIESQGDAARIRFTEAAHALMAAVAEEHPVILVVDDVHHADDVSLAVLHRIIRLADRQAILVYFLARLGELNQSPQAARLRDHGASLNIHQLALSTLPREESAELLDALLKELQLSASPTVRRTLLTAAAGYPLVLELLVRDWARSGDKSLAMALDAVTADTGSVGEPDEAYRLLVERLMSHLDPTTRNVLNVAAVLGPRLNDASMYALADLKVGEVMTGLTKLSELRILRDAGHRLEFVNDLIRAHAYIGVPAPVRRLLHDKTANALIALESAGDDSGELDIAWHCMRAGRTQEATSYLLDGAERSLRRGAPNDGERRLASAITHFVGPTLRRASVILAQLLQEQGRWQESLVVLNSWSHSEDRELVVLRNTALTWLDLGDLDAHKQRAGDAVALLADTSGSSTSLIAAVRLCTMVVVQTRDQAIALWLLDHMEAAHAVSRTTADALELEVAIAYLSFFARKPAFSERTFLQHLLSLVERTEARRYPNSRSFRLLSGVGNSYRRLGDYESARWALEEALEMAKRLDVPFCMANAHAHLSLCYADMGNGTQQLYHAQQARACTRGEFTGFTELIASYGEAAALCDVGRTSEAWDVLSRQERRLPARLAAWMRQAWLLYLADIAWLSDQRRRATAYAREALELSTGTPLDSSFVGAVARWLALLVREGDERLAGALVAMVNEPSAPDLWDEADRLTAILTLPLDTRVRAEIVARARKAADALPPTYLQHLNRFEIEVPSN